MTRRSFVPALAVALASLTLYLSTLAPGLVSLEDTPKFQFIGRVLGTAHNPSYPLYVLVSYLFGWLPVGNLAWRINLMSAVCGAATVALMQLCVLQITGSQWLGIGAALGLASGLSFWATSTFAEVYTLHACLIAGMTWCLLRWRRTRTASWFFLAILCFSLGLGHHTSIVVVGPAVAVFAMVVAPRFALAPRTLLATLVLFVAGFAQYLFVILRTRQGAYLESQATNLLELWDVIRGKAWADLVRPLSMETLSTTGPWVLRLIAQEVSLPMALAALGGAAVLLVRDRALLWLCGGAAVGIIMFSVMFPGQTAYFLLPAYFFVWTLAAVAADAVARWRWHDSVRARTAALPLCAVAVWHGWQNYGTNDLTHVRFVMRYFDAVTQQLPAASGIVGEDWLTDRLVLYEKFSDPSFDQRGLEAYADPASWRTAKSGGRPLFAFRGMTSELRWRGFDFEPRMWPLTYGPIREFLDDQRRGSVVAFAIPATHLTTALAHDAVPIDLMGEPIPAPSWSNLVVVGVLGHHGGLRFEQPAEQPTSVIANRGIPIGTTGVASPNHILVEASFDQASIQVNNRQVVSSSWPVVAVWNPHGIFQGAWAITPEGVMPMPESPVSLHRLRGVLAGTAIGATPVDVTRQSDSGQMIVTPVSDAPVVVYSARRGMLEPVLFDPIAGTPPLIVREFEANSPELSAALQKDGWPPWSRRDAMRVYRVELSPATSPRQLSFGGIPDAVWARWGGAGAPPLSYGLDLAGQLEPIDNRSDRLRVTRDHHQMLLANGWSAIETDDTETGGCTQSTSAAPELMIPCEVDSCASLTLQMRPLSTAGAVALTVNGTDLDTRAMDGVWQRYRWEVPRAARLAGMNSIKLRVTAPVYLSDVVVSRSATGER